MCLDRLALKHKKWLSIAYNICRNSEQAKDTVQEMYLKMYDISEKNKTILIKDAYVYVTILNIIKQNYKVKIAQQTFSLENAYNIQEQQTDRIEFSDEDLLYLQRAKEFRYLDRGLLELSYDKSLRQIEKETGINYMFVQRKLTKTRKLILRDNYDKKYKNSRLKNKKK